MVEAGPSNASVPQGAPQPTPRPNAPSVNTASLLSQLPPQAQQQLAGMNKEKLQQIVVRMQELKAQGQTEQTNPEYASLVQTLKACLLYTSDAADE